MSDINMQKEKNISNINNDSSEKRGTARIGNIVLITHWLDGDVIPFIRIGKELKKRGHEVTLITHCYFESMAKKAGLQFEAWDTKEEYEALVEDMSITQKRDSNNEGVLLLMDRYSEFHQKYEGKEIRLREYEKVKKYCQKENTVILCKNRSSIAAYMVAEELHLPLASVMMNPTEVISILSYEKLFEQKDVPELNDIRKSIGLKPIQTWLQWESSPKMTIALWPKWYDDNLEEWPSKIDMVGFPLENGKEAFNRQIPEEFALCLGQMIILQRIGIVRKCMRQIKDIKNYIFMKVIYYQLYLLLVEQQN